MKKVTVKAHGKPQTTRKFIAKDNDTLETEGIFDSMEALRQRFPGAEFTAIEKTETETIVYLG